MTLAVQRVEDTVTTASTIEDGGGDRGTDGGRSGTWRLWAAIQVRV